MEKIKISIAFLIILEIVLTGFLVYGRNNSTAGLCVIGEDANGCDSVQSSAYNQMFGVKLSYFGFFAFLILLGIFALDKKRRLFFVFSILGALFAVYFIYLQVFVLRQICSTCFVVDGTAILIFCLAFADSRKRRWSIG